MRNWFPISRHAATRAAQCFWACRAARTSEGVDFPGNQMNSVVVVGVPYAEPTPRVKAQIEYYDKRFPKLWTRIRLHFARHEKSLPSRRQTHTHTRGQRSHHFSGLPISAAYCKSFLPAWVTNGMKILPDKPGVLANEVSNFFRAQSASS